MKLKLDYKKIISEVITASLIIIISGIAIYSFIIISDQGVDVYNNSPKVEVMKGTNKIQEVLSIIENKYMEDVDVSKLIDGAIEGIFDTMEDQYTRYLTEEEYEEIKTQGNEQFTGIGVHISRKANTGEMVIVSVMPSTPAKEAGILSGDIVLKVNDIEVTKDNYTESVNNIKGEPGTTVKLVLKRGEEITTKEIKRKQLTANNVESDLLPGNIGYIRILEFENGIYDQFKTEYDELIKNKKIKGLIIDVRNNPGGIVSETVKITDLICGEGKILETIYRDGSKKVYMSDKEKIEVPLVVLVNEASASASEILAGAVKDLKQGTLVGKKTFGKGIVQSIIPLENGGAISITTAKYHTSSGIEIHGKGIMPNVEVELQEGSSSILLDLTKDQQVKAAIKIINEQ